MFEPVKRLSPVSAPRRRPKVDCCEWLEKRIKFSLKSELSVSTVQRHLKLTFKLSLKLLSYNRIFHGIYRFPITPGGFPRQRFAILDKAMDARGGLLRLRAVPSRISVR